MKLLRTVIIKDVVTEEMKQELTAEYELEVNQCEREIEQLTFQLHKAVKLNKHDEIQLRARYNKEITKRKEKREAALFKVQQLNKLELGSLIHSGTAESIIEIKIGDPWPKANEKTEIIINNGIIQDIRESRNEDD
ncbi:hypothetical protein GN156_01170 [bacterium LRH843]|nr:hypothetical protein [bacterium LRH843]